MDRCGEPPLNAPSGSTRRVVAARWKPALGFDSRFIAPTRGSLRSASLDGSLTPASFHLVSSRKPREDSATKAQSSTGPTPMGAGHGGLIEIGTPSDILKSVRTLLANSVRSRYNSGKQ